MKIIQSQQQEANLNAQDGNIFRIPEKQKQCSMMGSRQKPINSYDIFIQY